MATAVVNCIRVLNKFKNLKKKPYWGNHSWAKVYCMDSRITRILTFLNKSTSRSRFKLNEEDLSFIRTKAVETIRSHAVDFITSRIAPRSPKNDGNQTPMGGTLHLLPSMPRQPVAGDVCRNGVELKKARPWPMGRSIFLLIWLWRGSRQGIRRKAQGILVKGLDYYNRTTYEIQTEKLGPVG